MVDHIEANYRFSRIEGLEADDVMGVTATSDRAQCVIVSTDKDLRTVPGLLYNPKNDPCPRRVRPERADVFWLTQTLTGDQVDGYPGCPNIGPVFAAALMANPTRLRKTERVITKGKRAGQVEVKWHEAEPCTVWEAIVSRFEKAGLTEDDALLQARIARILRASDFDQTNNTVLLWHPSGRPTPHAL